MGLKDVFISTWLDGKEIKVNDGEVTGLKYFDPYCYSVNKIEYDLKNIIFHLEEDDSFHLYKKEHIDTVMFYKSNTTFVVKGLKYVFIHDYERDVFKELYDSNYKTLEGKNSNEEV